MLERALGGSRDSDSLEPWPEARSGSLGLASGAARGDAEMSAGLWEQKGGRPPWAHTHLQFLTLLAGWAASAGCLVGESWELLGQKVTVLFFTP